MLNFLLSNLDEIAILIVMIIGLIILWDSYNYEK